jgi:DNA-binding transcriptional LysR family regulator
VRPIAPDLFEQIDRSQLDLLIYPEDLVPKGVRVRSARLFTDRFVCAVDRDHPDVGERLTEEQFLTLPFVAFDGATMRTVSELRFIETGIDRSVEIGTQSFVSQPLMLPGTRLSQAMTTNSPPPSRKLSPWPPQRTDSARLA